MANESQLVLSGYAEWVWTSIKVPAMSSNDMPEDLWELWVGEWNECTSCLACAVLANSEFL